MNGHRILVTVSLAATLVYLSIGTDATGQVNGWLPPPTYAPLPVYSEPLFTAPGPFIPPRPRFYFTAGARYRSLQKIEFSQGDSQLQGIIPGAVPFGPSTPGPLVGSSGFSAATSPWVYSNGQINASPSGFTFLTTCTPDCGVGCTNPNCTLPANCGDCVGTPPNCLPAPCDALCSPPCTGTPPNCVQPTCVNCIPNDQTCVNVPVAWSSGPLGRIITTGSNVAPDACCNSTRSWDNIGFFVINNPSQQVDNPASIMGTSRVTFQGVTANGAAFTAISPAWTESASRVVWSPTFEIGYQSPALFDLFYGFSWYNLSRDVSNSSPADATLGRVGFVDTFPFVSEDPNPWPLTTFDSSNAIVAGNPFHEYGISPNSLNAGFIPNRRFITLANGASLSGSLQSTVNQNVEISVYENRVGARNWFWLWQTGRIGAYGGFCISPIFHKNSGSRAVINVADVIDPVSLAVIIPAGTVLQAQSDSISGWWLGYGGFIGSDAQVNYRNFFGRASVDYSFYNELSANVLDLETRFNPGGFGMSFSGGVNF